MPATFDSVSPASGTLVATFPVHDAAAVDAAVVRAREAAAWWHDLGFEGRRVRLLAFKRAIARRGEELVALVARENGKPRDDAGIEWILCVEHLDWAARHAERVLGPRKVSSTLLTLDQVGSLEYLPAGVVGVIGPWNYPVHTPMGSISYALAAGNAVVFKPSEHTPAVGAWLVDTATEAFGGEPVLQLLTGGGETGAALCRHPGIDVLAFTGSAATGRRVMAACAENLTKVVMECGGKDALIVAAGADLDKAAEAAVWGACSNAGQTCAGVERVYVVDAVHDTFVERVVAHAEGLRASADPGASLGPITMPGQVDVIRRHLEDALARGARALVGGPESVRPPFVDPVVLVDVPADAPLMTEETFGPLLPIARVRDVDEAVARANDSAYGLGATVYAGADGLAIARRLATGMVGVDAVLRFASIPALPFGGRGESGFGRIHGEDGLKEFTVPRAITRPRFRLPLELASFDRPRWLVPLLAFAVRALHGRR